MGGSVIDTVKEKFAAVREKRPGIDHVVRAFQRYQGDGGDRLAAAVTYFGFLAFFPLLALAFSVLGFVVSHDPSLRESITRHLSDALPGLIGNGSNQINVDRIAAAKAGAGVIGLLGLLYAGLGWVDALRQALRRLWHQELDTHNIAVKKLLDVVILVVLGLALLVSVLISSGATTLTGTVLGWVGLQDSLVSTVLFRVLAIALAVAADVAVFAWLFTGLPQTRPSGARILRGALLMAVLFEILKVVGSYYLSSTTANPVYGTFAAVVGLLVWINLVSRLLLFSAAWTITAPYTDDVPASGSYRSDDASAGPGGPEGGAERREARAGAS